MPAPIAPPCVIRAAVWPGDGESVRSLIREYVDSLGVDLAFQHLEEELASLPGAYAPPRGALLVATIAGEIAGIVAHRPLAGDACEMKRLYVRPAFRGREIGRMLADAILADARRAGYARMLLDTLESMKAARGLYAKLGFRACRPIISTRCRVPNISGVSCSAGASLRRARAGQAKDFAG